MPSTELRAGDSRGRLAGLSAVWASVGLVLAACGGGGSSGFVEDFADGGWTPGVFPSADTFAARCVNPRTGIDPASGLPYRDVAGTRTDENNFLRSYSNDTYLWYDEIVDRDPALFATPDYFDLLKTEATTPSGNPKDRFHFSLPTDEWFRQSTSGAAAGYGAQWAVLAASTPREIVVAYVDADTPAAAAGIGRGDELVAIDGEPVVDGDRDVLNAGLFPAAPGESHAFTIIDRHTQQTAEIVLVSEIVVSPPVRDTTVIDTNAGRVGYLLFNAHIATAEAALYDAIGSLAAQNVTDLVIDIRYNGGGFLDIASQLAYMIAGPARTAGRDFEIQSFNDKHPDVNPVTRQVIVPIPFHATTLGFSALDSGLPLPTLDLARVFVLTGPDTCSASESVVNSLRGIGVEVVQVGGTTCGKPYGFYPADNCGTTYFTIQFLGENDAEFGDYADGFSPGNAVSDIGTPVPGCAIADDFSRDLGDPLEARLAEALAYSETGACATPPAAATTLAGKAQGKAAEAPVVPRPAWLRNRILRR